jgi:hypothetical protein
MMAALFVLDNLKMGVGRQQTDGVFIPKSCSEPFFASNGLCWAQIENNFENTEPPRVCRRLFGLSYAATRRAISATPSRKDRSIIGLGSLFVAPVRNVR